MAPTISFPFSPRTTAIILAATVIPIALPAGYLYLLKRSTAPYISSSFTGRRPARRSKDGAAATGSMSAGGYREPVTLPAEVADDGPAGQYVLVHERVVSRPVPVSALSVAPDAPPSALMTAYSRATMEAFSHTPQAPILKRMVRGCEPGPRSFEPEWLAMLGFDVGDVADGLYRVVYRGDGEQQAQERIELALAPPEGYTGPVVHGVIVSIVQRAPATGSAAEPKVVFINETWIWRREGEKPSILETTIGGWMHSLMAGWLIMKGIKAVTADGKGKKDS